MPVRRPADRNRLLRQVVTRTLAAVPGLNRMASGHPRVYLAPAVPNYQLDLLEARQLLTTLAGGGMSNGIAVENFLTYRDAEDHEVRIALRGNVLAEFIFLKVDGSGDDDGLLDNNSTRLVDAVPFLTGTNGNAGEGADLFAVYVTQADRDASIVISAVNQTTGVMIPFSSDGGSIRYNNATTGVEEDTTIAATTGSILLGARTKALDNVDNGPDAGDALILNRFNTAAIGVRPASLGRVFAGLDVAKGQTLGKFYFGGTVTGRVHVTDNMGEFYAGNIFTGEANQQLIGNGSATSGVFLQSNLLDTEAPHDPGNFYVGGDIEQILVAGNIGALGASSAVGNPETSFLFKSGFSGRIGGRLGSVNAKGAIVGGFTILNSGAIKTRGLAQREIEQRGVVVNGAYFEGSFNGVPSLSDQPKFFNDSFDTAQYLGTFYNKELRSASAVQVTGLIGGGESVDYYAVPLLAGQTVSAQVLGTLLDENGNPAELFSLGIFDPDQRLIVSDESTKGIYYGSKMKFTADRPGMYYFAVARPGNSDFGAAAGPTGGQNPYALRIDNVGTLTAGTIAADGPIATYDIPIDSVGTNGTARSLSLESSTLEIRKGDLGAVLSLGTTDIENDTGGGIFSGSGILGVGGFGASPYTVRNGNLRVLDAATIGTGGNFNSPDLLVPFGNVGLVRSDELLGLNPSIFSTLPGEGDNVDPARSIGGSYQLIDATGALTANLGAKAGIGVIRAASTSAPRWAVNTDNSGNDGIIDLIYVTGDLGTLGGGGPQISTGIGGNVRYMRVLGNTFRDIFYGAAETTVIRSIQGRTLTLTDDSGTLYDLVPPPDPDGTVDATAVGTAGTLTATAYGIRDKAGVVLVNVDVAPASGQPTNGFGSVTGAGGLIVRSRSAGKNGSVEIGNINVQGGGSTTIYNATGSVDGTVAGRSFTTATGISDDLTFSGSTPIDVFQITATSTLGKVNNQTRGELVNISATSVNSIEAQQVGLAKSRTSTEVGGAAITAAYPFSTTQRNLVNVGGAIAGIRSRRGIGAVQAANIGLLLPNSDNKHEAGYFEGLNAPIVASGAIIDVHIGQGIPFSGAGNFAYSGLYAGTLIGTVTNDGTGADIRGDVIVTGANAGADPISGFALGGIGLINLGGGGSIIGADIGSGISTGFIFGREVLSGVTFTDTDLSAEAPTFDIGQISTTGKGGIIGCVIGAADVGPITVSGGFGFINNYLRTLGDGNNAGITTDGYGIRSTTIRGGYLGKIVANGNGKLLKTTDYSSSVRASELNAVDPGTGREANAFTDLHLFLGTTKIAPRKSDASEAGTIADSLFFGQRDLDSIDAWRIRGHQPDPENPIPVSSSSFPMRISYSNAINKIRVREKIDGLNLSGGSVNSLSVGNDVNDLYMSTAGRIKTINVKGSLLSSSTINNTGPDAQIDVLQIGKRLVGRVQTSLDIKSLLVGTDLFSRQVIVGRNLYKLSVGGSVKAGTNVKVGDRLVDLHISKNFEAGATIRARRIGTQFIGGEFDGDLVIG